MAREHGCHQQNRRDLGEFGRLDIQWSDADPALCSKGGGADQAHGDQADHRGAVDRDEQRPQPLQRQPPEAQGKQTPHRRGDPVVIPVGVVGLALGAGDQHPSDAHHGQRNSQENPVLRTLLSARLGTHRHTAVVTCCITESARLRNAAELAESGRDRTAGRPESPPS